MLYYNKNPFNIIFGMKPQSFIVRQKNREEILNDFKNSEHGSIAIVTGVRGSGKTIFLSDTAKELDKEKNWITIILNPELNLYENAFVKLNKALKTNSIHAKFEAYDIKLAEFVYDKIYSELSEKDIQFTEAIYLKNLQNVKDLCSYLKITPKQFSPYRDRLIKKGIIIPLKRGEFRIALPRFAEYIKERKLFE